MCGGSHVDSTQESCGREKNGNVLSKFAFTLQNLKISGLSNAFLICWSKHADVDEFRHGSRDRWSFRLDRQGIERH